MIVLHKSILCFFLLFVVLFVEAAATTLKEKILSDRTKRAVQLEYAYAALQKQMENHDNGVKVFDNNRLKSLKVRMNSYKAQIFEASRALSPQELKELIIVEERKIEADKIGEL
mmetsp:Transcript_36700/g.41014  ORF Transcript_36700/g.41014 Transcript_36700/m.41014 type:complete len:114 (-) Transcript_36700:493-834(-)